ncbi:hypothetical protein [Methylobacterium sp. GC_Met_2]|uniref:hypothetical protein n=1 Tax=Methylobacterium sp. GC_Met_2 TaxID=2937376 RepID=UPI00226B6F45|nr:hypothetical protein [Methylobacterium sp. GC_Met_2]
MPHHAKTSVVTTLIAEGLMALLTGPQATAQERITLETIGAVRMARFDEVRRAGPEFRPAQAAQPRDPAAGRTAKAR